MNIAFFGSSLVSSYWNGAATYYRGLLKALAARGHRIAFYEPNAFDRQRHRDIAELVGASRPRITEHLIEFEEKKLITREDHHFIVHRDRIESFLAQIHPVVDGRFAKAATGSSKNITPKRE